MAPKYKTIVVDPPWRYDQTWGSTKPFLFYGTRGRAPRGAAGNYNVIDSERIADLPLGDWADEQAHLYVWTTNSFMRDAYPLIDAWGFVPKTIITWVKHREDQAWLGMGTYYRNATEHAIFCVRGGLKVARKDCSTYFYAGRGGHSEKPQAFYDMVETMSPGPYLDVFARKQRFGWDVWGNEVYCAEGLPTPEQVFGNA